MAIPGNKYSWGQFRIFNNKTKKFYGGEAQMTCQDVTPGNIDTRIFKVTDAQARTATGTVDASLKSADSTDKKIGYGSTTGGDTTDGAVLAEGICNWILEAKKKGVCGINPERTGKVITLEMEMDGEQGNGTLIDAAQTLITDGGVVVDSQFSGGKNLLLDQYFNVYDKDDVKAGPIDDVETSYYTGVQDADGIPIYQHHEIAGSFEVQDSKDRKRQYKNFSASSAIVWKDGGWEVELTTTDKNSKKFSSRLGKGILYSNQHYRDGVHSPETCTVLGGGGTIFSVTLQGAPFNETLQTIDNVIVEDPNGGSFSADQNITANCSMTNSAGGMCAIDTVGGVNNGGQLLVWYTVGYSPLIKPSVKGRDSDYKKPSK